MHAPRPDPTRIMDMASAFYDSSVLFAAIDAGLFAELAARGDADVAALAAARGLDARACRMLCDACTALGLLVKTGERYANGAEAAAFLVPGSPMDLGQAIRYNRDVYGAWGRLPELLRTGRPVEPPEMHLGDDPRRTRDFVLAMHGRAMAIGRAVVPQLRLEGRRRLLDVGGGSGAFAMLAAQANPDLACVVLDLPGVIRVARELIAQAGLAARVTCVEGDYHHAALPGGVDAVNIVGVLHQESPAAIRDILCRSHAALAPGGILNVVDMMTDASRCRPKFSALFALNMALTTRNGWVFSSDDLAGWVGEAGFADFACRPLPPPLPHWIATARRA